MDYLLINLKYKFKKLQNQLKYPLFNFFLRYFKRIRHSARSKNAHYFGTDRLPEITFGELVPPGRD
jgi:hypothetical protein